jgi:hypothetical protein
MVYVNTYIEVAQHEDAAAGTDSAPVSSTTSTASPCPLPVSLPRLYRLLLSLLLLGPLSVSQPGRIDGSRQPRSRPRAEAQPVIGRQTAAV